MAYNPFNIFRRNQKMLFAVLTVFIMIMFTLQSGVVGGDAFESISRWLGGRGSRGDELCTIDGEKIYQGDLTRPGLGLQAKRTMANRYMSAAALRTAGELERIAQELRGSLGESGRSFVNSLSRTEQQLQMLRQFPSLAGQAGFGSPEQLAMQLEMGYEMMADSPTLEPEAKEYAKYKLESLRLQSALVGGEHYFVAAPNTTLNDLINFKLWQMKADKLGIKFTREDVMRLIQIEFYGEFRSNVQTDVQKQLAERIPGFNMEDCLDAVAEEFRVRTAQATILGSAAYAGRQDKTLGGFPSFTTPFDEFKFYQDQCSPTSYLAIPVSVEKFIDQVNAELANGTMTPPTNAELDLLYKKYRDAEPNPGRKTPGFRIPRMIKVAWFAVSGNEDYYVKRAKDDIELGTQIARIGLATPSFGGMGTLLAATTAPIATEQGPLTTIYEEEYKTPHENALDRWDSVFMWGVLDRNVYRPENLAAAAPAFAGQLLAVGGNPFDAVGATVTWPYAFEIKDRMKGQVIPALLDTLQLPGTRLSNLAAKAHAEEALKPKPLPMSTVLPALREKWASDKAKQLAVADIAEFVKKMAELSKDGTVKDTAEVQKYVKEFAEKRGLAIQESLDLHSEWTIEEEKDPALAPLIEAHEKSLREASSAHAQSGQPSYVPFGRKFFWDDSNRTITGTYAAQYYPNQTPLTEITLDEDNKQYVVWRTAEEQPRPQNFDEAREDVVNAWKWQKAREKAKTYAEGMVATIGSFDSTSPITLEQQLRELAAKPPLGVGAFEIKGVCPLTKITDPTQPDIVQEFRGAYQPFRLSPTQNVKYPTQEMLNALLDKRKDPFKTAMVLPNAPESTFFVTTLTETYESNKKTQNDYMAEMMSPQMRNRVGAFVVQSFRFESIQDARQSVIELLKKEFNYEVTEEQKKRLEENANRDSQS